MENCFIKKKIYSPEYYLKSTSQSIIYNFLCRFVLDFYILQILIDFTYTRDPDDPGITHDGAHEVGHGRSSVHHLKTRCAQRAGEVSS